MHTCSPTQEEEWGLVYLKSLYRFMLDVNSMQASKEVTKQCIATGSSAILTDVVTRVIVRLLLCVNASQNNKKPNCKNFQWQKRQIE